jgi:polar amino acid transport system ATP-binding protein
VLDDVTLAGRSVHATVRAEAEETGRRLLERVGLAESARSYPDRLVAELKEQGSTILMTTHEMHFAEHAADRVVFLEDGRIAEEGTPSRCSATRSRRTPAPSSPASATAEPGCQRPDRGRAG